MPTFIPARGRTLHVAGICINRIGNEPRSSEGARLVAHLGPINLQMVCRLHHLASPDFFGVEKPRRMHE